MTVTETDAKQRFSNRAEDYARYRPGYPPEILAVLREECGLRQESIIADIGSGTGLLAQLFLENGNVVYGVEPNAAMREAGERCLKHYPRFRSVAGSAEATALAAGSVDFVVAGQAFHWFDAKLARAEFARVLRPGGWVAVIWNQRKKDATLFLSGYENLLQTYGTDYEQVVATYPDQRRMEQFFGAGAFQHRSFASVHRLDREGLRGRAMSASYSPPPGHPNHEPLVAGLKRLFEEHQQGGQVRFDYETHVYYGHLKRENGKG